MLDIFYFHKRPEALRAMLLVIYPVSKELFKHQNYSVHLSPCSSLLLEKNDKKNQ